MREQRFLKAEFVCNTIRDKFILTRFGSISSRLSKIDWNSNQCAWKSRDFSFSPQVTEPWPESVDERFLQKTASVCPQNSGEVYLKPGVKSCVMWRLSSLSQRQTEPRQGLNVSSGLEMPRNLSGEAERVTASTCLTCCHHILTLDRRNRGR